jgi:hypothetical protein
MLEPLVKWCIPLPKKLYKCTRRLRTIDEVEEYFPDFKAFIDSLFRTGDTKTKEQKEKEKELLLWQKEEAHYQDTIYGKQ